MSWLQWGALLLGCVAVLFFAVFTGYYFRNRRIAMEARRRMTGPSGRGVPPLLVLCLMVMVVALAGCKIQIALDTKVEANGSGTVGVRLAADKEIQDLMAQQAGQQGDLFAEFKKQIPKDWVVDSGTDADGTKWVSASKGFKDTAELDALLAGQAQGGLGGALAGDTFSVKQSSSLFAVTTTFDATWNAGKALAEAQKGISDAIPIDSLSSVFQVENRLTLPGAIRDNNATEVQGNTLVWRPPLKGATALHARSVAVRWGIMGAFIAAGALVVSAAVIIGVLALTRGRRRVTPHAPPDVAPDAPVDPDAPLAPDVAPAAKVDAPDVATVAPVAPDAPVAKVDAPA